MRERMLQHFVSCLIPCEQIQIFRLDQTFWSGLGFFVTSISDYIVGSGSNIFDRDTTYVHRHEHEICILMRTVTNISTVTNVTLRQGLRRCVGGRSFTGGSLEDEK